MTSTTCRTYCTRSCVSTSMTCGQRSGLPSFAGAASRMDLLLKAEKIVVECKMARKGLGPKEVGEQLITDIARDKAHPDCDRLVCFVYDPQHVIKNPRGLKKDLNTLATSGTCRLKVEVIVVP